MDVDDTRKQKHKTNSRKKQRQQAPPVLHLQDAVSGQYVDDGECKNAKAGDTAKTVEKTAERIAFRGHARQPGDQSSEKQNGKAE